MNPRGYQPLAVGSSAVATIGLTLLLISPTAAGSPSSLRTWLAPFPNGHQFGWGFSGNGAGCNGGYDVPAQFWIPPGRFYVNVSNDACQAAPYWSTAGGRFHLTTYAGLDNLTFKSPSTGTYNVSSFWNGYLWANVSAAGNGTPSSVPVFAGYVVTATTSVYSLKSGTNVSSNTFVVGARNITVGSLSLRIPFHQLGPYSVNLLAGTGYVILVWISVTMFGLVSAHAHYGAAISASVDGRPGLYLDRVAIG